MQQQAHPKAPTVSYRLKAKSFLVLTIQSHDPSFILATRREKQDFRDFQQARMFLLISPFSDFLISDFHLLTSHWRQQSTALTNDNSYV